jgi:Mn-dependent DtxR family transcriptional regulator
MLDCTIQNSHTIEFKILMEFLKKVTNQSPQNYENFTNLLKKTKIKPVELASQLNSPTQTINSALKRMEERKQIIWKKYKEVGINMDNEESLIHLQNHIHLVEDFLIQTLNISKEEAFKEALKIAPIISCELAERICEKYHYNHCKGLVIYYPECHDHAINEKGGE